MLTDAFQQLLEHRLQETRDRGLYKEERVITSRQGARIEVRDAPEVLNFCANNYLGLAGDPRLVERAKAVLDERGYGMASVRFICGTQDIHRELEGKVARFLDKDDAVLYSSCFDANGGLFETILSGEDAVISDQLNHASIIDGIRLCKAKRFRYEHMEMQDLERNLIAAREARNKLIVTDGVFSMDGEIAPLNRICELAERYGALVVVDDSHATGFFGPTGRGTPEHFGCSERVDIVTSTFGKAMGGASGGFTAGPAVIAQALRQFSRPYLFSNSVAPMIVGTTIAVVDMLEESSELIRRLDHNQRRFRRAMTEKGFNIIPGAHPIVPVMLYNARLATRMADELLEEGIYVIGFSYPVVPKGQARIRVQLSAAHTDEQLSRAINAFVKIGDRLGVLGLGKDEIIERFGL
ncbi:MAG: glycine C-acetyltransferase [Candidatus Coatesbacteria bacterium]|nr:glycine C-acetyltransferase [Candidatus Coatesbacteria bacterium]